MLCFYPDFTTDMGVVDYFISIAGAPFYLLPICILLWAGCLIYVDSRSYSSSPGEFVQFDGARKDEDVTAEEQRVISTAGTSAQEDEAARYKGLSHTYRSKVQGQWKETHAVRG